MLISGNYRNETLKFGCTQTKLCEPVKNVVSEIAKLSPKSIKLDENKVGNSVRDFIEDLIKQKQGLSHKNIAEYLEKLLNIDLPIISKLIILATIGKSSVRKAAFGELLNNRTFWFNLETNCENKVIKEIAKCPDCNGKLQKKGFNLSKIGKTQRYFCDKCKISFDETKVKITEEEFPEIRCRHCDSSNVKKRGKFDDVQIYECKDCGENSLETYKYARKFPMEPVPIEENINFYDSYIWKNCDEYFTKKLTNGEKYKIKCPSCNSKDFIKLGKTSPPKEVQKFRCANQDCLRTFQEEYVNSVKDRQPKMPSQIREIQLTEGEKI